MKKHENNIDFFEKLLKECCDSENLDAIYIYAMHLEKNDSTIKQSINYYVTAASKGHFDSLIRLINILEIKSNANLYSDYLELSVGIFNETILIRLINMYDENENYTNSNILIKIGLMINYHLFNIYYIDHLLYGKGMDANKKRAKKLAILAFKENYICKNDEKYIYLMLQAFVVNDEHINALKFLFKFRRKLSKNYREDFLKFYEYLDKNVAKKYFIAAYFYYPDFLKCHNLLMDFHRKNENMIKIYADIYELANTNKNPFALAIVGKIYKLGKFFIRDLRTAIKYFSLSAELGCPLGYYYIGKEFFYGRYLQQDYEKAKKNTSFSYKKRTSCRILLV